MVYTGETPENDNMPSQEMATRTAQEVKMLGAGVVKVVQRCMDAKETQILDISSCSLIQVPDAVFFLMRASNGKDYTNKRDILMTNCFIFKK